jgi:cyclopropane fatty-acyl-phospholipid synthase-like methyltransferase
MDSLDLFTIAERDLELVNPNSTEKIILAGKMLGMGPGKTVIDFGSGYAEPLIIWAENFGISGVGIEFREACCDRAQKKIAERGLGDRLEIVHKDASKYKFRKGAYDLAICLGASFIWGGFGPTLRKLKQAVRPGGKVAIGEPYWNKTPAPKEYVKRLEGYTISTEHELLKMAQTEKYDFEYIVRTSLDDWDRYETGNWYGLHKWLYENQGHPDRQQVIDWLRKNQEEYLRWGREYLGWAIYLMRPSPKA